MRAAANIGLRRVIETLQAQGARSVAAAMAQPALHRWLDALECLRAWADVHPVGPSADRSNSCRARTSRSWLESASRSALRTRCMVPTGEWMAAALRDGARDVTRHAAGKHRILEVMAAQGVPLPDTPAMAVHRGRLDLLEEHLRRDPDVLGRALPIDDIYPLALGCHESAISRCMVRRSTEQRCCTWRSSTRISTLRAG